MKKNTTVVGKSPALVAPAPRMHLGVDIVQISAIRASLAEFGARFERRIFSAGEIAYARTAPAQTAQRFAARFAAKEAAIKAFDLSEAGVAWRDIEVLKLPGGRCRLALHGRAAEVAERTRCSDIALSLSHDGDYATAVVAALAPQ